MKKHRILSLLAALIILLAVVPALAATIKVPTDQPDIQTAIGVANDNDTILVEPNTYTVPAAGYLVDKALTIKGQKGADFTILETTGTNGTVFKIKANNVTVSGFTMRPPYGTDLSGAWLGAIFVGGVYFTAPGGAPVTGVTITKCIIEFFPFGIVVLNADGAQITKNTIRYCPNQFGVGGIGIRMVVRDGDSDSVMDYAITNTLIQSNIIHDNGSWGIYVENEAPAVASNLGGTKIMANTLYKNNSGDITIPPYNYNGKGIHIDDVLGVIEVTNNKFLALVNNQDPIEVGPGAPGVVRSGNKTYPSLKGALTGGSVDIP